MITKADSSRTSYHYAETGVGERAYPCLCVRTIDPAICDANAPSQPTAPPNYEYDRGQLKYQSDYNAHWQVVKTIAYHHDYDSTRLVTPAYQARYIAGAGLASAYVRRGYWQTKSTITETLYDLTGANPAPIHVTSQAQYFTSRFHHQATRTVQAASSGDTLETRIQYSSDLRAPEPDALADGNASFTTACASCDLDYQSRLHNCAADDCRYNAYVDNLICRASAQKAYIAYRRQNFTDSLNIFQVRHDAAKNAADARLHLLLQLQDDSRLAVVETSRWKNQLLLGATYSTFGSGLSQPNTLYSASQFALFLSNPSPQFNAATVANNSICLDSHYTATPETTLKFDNGNVVEVRLKTGIITSYLWGYANTLPIARATGVSYATLQMAYQKYGNLTAMRTAPVLAHALLSTYVHQPLVGVTSQTDPTGWITGFEYDALGRLVRTRDEQDRILSQQQYHYAGK
jgi:YD repeat-containing protein